MVEFDRLLLPGTPLWIAIPGIGHLPATIIGSTGTRHACRFVVPFSARGSAHAPFATTIEFSEHGLTEADRAAASLRRWPLLVRVVIALTLACLSWAMILVWL